MGILDRLGNVLRSYLSGEDGAASPRREGRGGAAPGDRDYDEAYAELDDFLNGKEGSSGSNGEGRKKKEEAAGAVPPELRGDFEALGVPFGAGEAACKEAYKKLLKIHHPDRHAGHAENMRKATERSAGINAAWDRIEKWRKGEPL
jgi:DnaJ-class molecular chaperone